MTDYILGIDFGRPNIYQGAKIDPRKAIARGVKFAAARFTVGNYMTDTTAIANFDIFQDAGVMMGAYHVVADLDKITGRKITASSQIQRFKDAVADRRLDYPAIADCEVIRTDKKYLTSITVGCVTLLHGFKGHPFPMIYTRGYWWNANITRLPTWQRYPLFVANYGVLKPYLPADWPDWACWQHSADGNLLGDEFGFHSASIDLDYWNPAVLPFPNGAPIQPPVIIPITEHEVYKEIQAKIEELKKAFPGVSVVLAVTVPADEEPEPVQPKPTGKKYKLVSPDGKPNVKLRTEASPAVGGSALKVGTVVTGLGRETTAYKISWVYVTDGVLTGWVKSVEAKPA
jgi:GH25 family lysozyme M1 (1,4-beta-N-acetylmuramidase)